MAVEVELSSSLWGRHANWRTNLDVLLDSVRLEETVGGLGARTKEPSY